MYIQAHPAVPPEEPQNEGLPVINCNAVERSVWSDLLGNRDLETSLLRLEDPFPSGKMALIASTISL